MIDLGLVRLPEIRKMMLVPPYVLCARIRNQPQLTVSALTGGSIRGEKPVGSVSLGVVQARVFLESVTSDHRTSCVIEANTADTN